MAGAKLTGPAFPYVSPNNARFSYGGRFFYLNRSQDSPSSYPPHVYEIVGNTYVERPTADSAIGTYNVNGAAISSDGRYVAFKIAANDVLRIWEWDGSTYQVWGNISLGTGYGRGVVDFSYNDQFLAAGGYGGIRILNVAAGFANYSFIDTTSAMLDSTAVESAKFSPDGLFLAVACRERVQAYYVGSASPTRIYNTGLSSWGCSWSKNSRDFFAAKTVLTTGGNCFRITGSSGSATVSLASLSDVPNSSWNNQDGGAWLTLNDKEYLIVSQVGGGPTAQVVCDPANWYLATSPAKTLADFEIFGMTGTGGAVTDSAYDAAGNQVFLSDRGSSGLQVWKLSTTVQVTGGSDLPRTENSGAAQVGPIPTDSLTPTRLMTTYIALGLGGEKLAIDEGGTFLYQTSDLPRLEMTGFITPGVGVFGVIDLPLMETSGTVGQPNVINAEIDLPLLETNGELFSGELIESTIDLPLLETSANIYQDFIVNGIIDLPLMETNGIIFRGHTIGGGLVGKKMIASGRLGSVLVVGEMVSHPMMGDGFLNNSPQINGELNGKLPTADGVVAMPYFIDGEIIGLRPVGDGQVDMTNYVDAILRGLRPTGSGQLKYTQTLTAELIGKIPVSDGELKIARFVNGELIGKLPTVIGRLTSGFALRGTLIGKRPSGTGELMVLPKIAGELIGQLPTGDGFLFNGYRINGNLVSLTPTGNGLLIQGVNIRGGLIGRRPTGNGLLGLPPFVYGDLAGKRPVSDGYLEIVSKYRRWLSIID